MLKRVTKWFRARTSRPYRRISLTGLAVEVSAREEGKVNLPIAQISEVLKHTLDLLAEASIDNPRGFAELFNNRVAQVKRARKLVAES